MNFRIIIVLVLILIGGLGYSQELVVQEEMITDRPDETEAPNLIPKGFLQIETGAFYEESSESGLLLKTTGYNTTLFRYGLLENLELRLGSDFLRNSEEVNGLAKAEINSGFTPLLIGAKIGIAEEKGILPQMGLIIHLRMPFTAAEEYRPETTGIDFRFAFSHKLSGNSNLSYNFGAEWLNDAAKATYIYTIAYGYDFTNKLGIFVEIYGDIPENAHADHFCDGGVTYNLRNNLQLDAYIGTGLNSSQDFLVGGGLSYRILN